MRDAPIAAKAVVRFLAAVIATILLVAILLHDLDLVRGDFAVATAHVETQMRKTHVSVRAFFHRNGKTDAAQTAEAESSVLRILFSAKPLDRPSSLIDSETVGRNNQQERHGRWLIQ
jgi:hypothetical protein